MIPVAMPLATSWRKDSTLIPEVRAANVFILLQHLGRPGENHAASFKHASEGRKTQCERGVLLDQQHRHLLLSVQPLQDAEDIFGDLWRESLRRLVKQKQPWAHHQRTAYCQHLLLAAAESTRNAISHE